MSAEIIVPAVAVIAGACALAAVTVLVWVARVSAFSRHVDQRGVQRAKFQESWTAVLKAADERGRDQRKRRAADGREYSDEEQATDNRQQAHAGKKAGRTR